MLGLYGPFPWPPSGRSPKLELFTCFGLCNYKSTNILTNSVTDLIEIRVINKEASLQWQAKNRVR